jgi:hypothetical protein
MTQSNSSYNNLTDYAWGSDTVGWLSVNASGGACTPTYVCSANQLVDTTCGQASQACTYGCTNGATSCNNPPRPPPPLTGCISINNASCAAPTKTLRVRSSSTVQLYWNVQNVSTSCTVIGTGGDTESWNHTPVAGVVTNTVTTRAITQVTNFTLSCDSGAFTDQATVNMVPVTTMTARMGRPSSLGIAREGLAESNVARSVSDLASTLSPEKLFPSTGRSVRLRRARTTHALVILRTRSY